MFEAVVSMERKTLSSNFVGLSHADAFEERAGRFGNSILDPKSSINIPRPALLL
jgi:hypothetical protein